MSRGDLRLFVALDLPEPLREALMDVQDGLGVGREVPEDDLHVTLAFLDGQNPQVVEVLHDMLSAIRMVPVRLTVKGLELFGGRRPNLVAALVEKVPELAALQEKVAQAARMAGIDLPRRRFRPHVTLLRFPGALSPEGRERIAAYMAAHGDIALDGSEAVTFSLYQSHLRAGGPVYEALARYPLTAAG
ncbi:RNA 2',3'-cyclic phosphodiesterase [Thalassovita sp.]|uniref:RNA 2',3'-cyclic phosphodiesterase n=1 Tax=Thalassovita sp. TaxID=1979401 RepID=UPI002B276197|nr:RNA 2',3'-cyclic phosphodiesterase [Thalassovita sp.]